MEIRRCCPPVRVADSAAVTPGEYDVVDGDHFDEGKMKERSSTSIVSWSVVEMRLERARSSGASGVAALLKCGSNRASDLVGGMRQSKGDIGGPEGGGSFT
jgi:hypothetical protein